jgi:glycosyltransferase involved in cell wall biosynthesis
MKVMMLTNAVEPDKSGGLERYVRELAAELAALGTDVTVVTKQLARPRDKDERGEDGVRVVRVRPPSKRSPLFAALYPVSIGLGSDRAIRSVPDDTIVHAHFPIPAVPLLLRRRRYVYTFHAPLWRELLSERHGTYFLPTVVQRPAVSGVRTLERAVVRRAKRVLVLSAFSRENLCELDRDAGAEATLLPGGVDLKSFVPGDGIQDGWAESAEPLLVAVRRLTPRTGVKELVAAMPAVRSAFPRARLAIAGAGVLESELRRQIVELELDGAVRLLGHITNDELVGWYRSARLAVMPTQELEGFGLATIEALACGTPVVATPVGANPELVGPLSSELLARDVTPDALADAIVSLLRQPRLLDSVRARARDHVPPELGWRRIAETHLEIYREAFAR